MVPISYSHFIQNTPGLLVASRQLGSKYSTGDLALLPISNKGELMKMFLTDYFI